MKTIPIDKIVLSDTNVRKTAFDIEELTNSIKIDGIVEPIILRPNGDKFEVVAGQRRFIACKEAGYKELKIPNEVLIKDLTDEEALRISLIENIHQQELDPMDKANALKELVELEGIDVSAKRKKRGLEDAMRRVAEKTGLAWHMVETYLRLLRASPEIQKAVSEKKIPIHIASSYVHGFPIKVQNKLAEVITGLKTEEARDIIQYLRKHPKTSPERAKEIVFSKKKHYYRFGMLGEIYYPLIKEVKTKKHGSLGDLINKILKEWVSKK